MSLVGHLHPPAPDFASIPLPLVDNDDVWSRLHRSVYDPCFYDFSPASRFNASDGAYGVLYAGEDLDCCFVETLLRLDVPQLTSIRAIRMHDLRQRNLARLHFVRPMKLVDLTGEGLGQIGAHSGISSAPYDEVRPWSRAIWMHPQVPDGILYRARHNPECICLALYDRTKPDVALSTTQPLLTMLSDVAVVLDKYRVALRP